MAGLTASMLALVRRLRRGVLFQRAPTCTFREKTLLLGLGVVSSVPDTDAERSVVAAQPPAIHSGECRPPPRSQGLHTITPLPRAPQMSTTGWLMVSWA